MPKACQLKKGNVVRINGQLYGVREIAVQSPSARGSATLYKVRFEQVQSRQKLDQTYRGDDQLEEVQLSKRQVEYSYQDGDECVFMDVEDFNQYNVSRQALGEQADWLVEGLAGILAIMLDSRVIAIELPPAIESDIVDTSPAIKGASATARSKPATLENGVVIQVPEYLSPGERVRVSTEDGRFLGRA